MIFGAGVILALPLFLLHGRKHLYISILCLLANAALCVSWVRSLTARESFVIAWQDFKPKWMDCYELWVEWGNGGISLNYDVGRYDDPGEIARAKAQPNPRMHWHSNWPSYPYFRDKNAYQKVRPFPERWGFRFLFERSTHLYNPPESGPMTWFITVPHWFLMLLLSIAPAFWLRRFWRQHRRRKLGLCLVCGYDLRATPDRCPECGTVPAPQNAPNKFGG